MGVCVVACYRPKTGCSTDDVLAVVRDRLPLLRCRFDRVCDYVPIAEVPEAAQLFSGFDPLG